MFAKAEVSTGSYTLSMTLCGNYSQLNINIEQSLYRSKGSMISGTMISRSWRNHFTAILKSPTLDPFLY